MTAGHEASSSNSKSKSKSKNEGPPKLRLYTPVLQRLWATGEVEEARRVWEEMVARGAMPNEDHIVAMVRWRCPLGFGMGLCWVSVS